jgi:hypothetical protein
MASFEALHKELQYTDLINPSLTSDTAINSEITETSLASYLQAVLTENENKIWFCPTIIRFIDDQKSSKIKELQEASLMKMVKILLQLFLFFFVIIFIMKSLLLTFIFSFFFVIISSIFFQLRLSRSIILLLLFYFI